ncbi:UNKNOWN [Stylonychia lemnae]|uniref:Uncharacterized protein n=1 Tax=Stylonychia lemnae TaxID=5949 RepID=A0A078A330_STYLE|nr:UNKNOWN [Stylonychia lemnae]|eukprot:CDW76232.1 UNKNOWN [Stylonychia lemnae]
MISQQEQEEDQNQFGEEHDEEVVSEQDSIESMEDEEKVKSRKIKKERVSKESDDDEDENSQVPKKSLAVNDTEESRVSNENRRQTRRSKYAEMQNEDIEMRSSSSNSTVKKGSQSKKHKKKKDKKKKKKKDKKKKDKKKKKKKKKRGNSSSSDSSNSSEDSDEDWKFDDKGVDYGSPERISDGSSVWDGRSQELYDSDNPEYPLNLYHIESKPRILEIEDFNQEGDPVRLLLDQNIRMLRSMVELNH